MQSIWYRSGLSVVAIGLAAWLWHEWHQPMPDPMSGGFAALGLGVVVVLLAASFWKK
ncbi:hypothetical protein [Lacticaseibacillus jixiensis]|uniref:hypothetical protein n=1 Tax=Lacticaseibacillus jixiensis TaxID=3231926 RepID=UPI0036F1B99F